MACEYLFNGKWYTEDQLKELHSQRQQSLTIPSKASPATMKKVSTFLARMGVEIKILQDIVINGERIGANGVTDAMRGLVYLASGKENVALTEEGAHIAVSILKQKGSKYFTDMMNQISKYNILNDVIQEYKDNKAYQNSDGSINIPKMKEEAIGKLVAQTMINLNENSNERPDLIANLKTWWEKVLDWLKLNFLRTGMNPFEEIAATILDRPEAFGNFEESAAEEVFYQQFRYGLNEQLKKNDINTAKTENGFEVNGQPAKDVVDEEVSKYLRKIYKDKDLTGVARQNKEFKAETEDKVKEDIQDILNRYIDDNNERRADPLEQSTPSSVNPYDNSFYNTLEDNIATRLKEYPADTKFYKDVNLYNDKSNTAANVDFLAVRPDDKIDILQFKVPELANGAKDINRSTQESYNIEIEALRNILVKAYGVKRDQFEKTRAIPIKAEYEYSTPGEPNAGLKVKTMNIGNTNVKVISDDTLLPIASESELTGSKKLDALLSKLRGLAERFSQERVDPQDRSKKAQRIAELLTAIRKLQIQGKADGVLLSGKTLVKRQQEKFDRLTESIKNTDPNKATIQELSDIAKEILDEKDEIELYTTLDHVFEEIFGDGTDESKEYIARAREIADDARRAVNRYWDMAVEFRKTKTAAKWGIKDEFLPEKQMSGYQRLVRSLSQGRTKAAEQLWKIVNRINQHSNLEFQERLKTLKGIEDKVDEWLKGKSVTDLYNKIFQMRDGKWNGKMIQKISKDFFTGLREAQEKGNFKWVKDNIDVEAYNKWFVTEHQRRIDNSKNARIHENDEENKKRKLQELQDFVNTFSLSTGKGVNSNNYKLRDFPIQDKWLSEEYKELQKADNAPVMALYNHWIARLEESWNEGLIDEHNGWSWFPNVRRNILEKLTLSKAKIRPSDFIRGLTIEAEDTDFGKIDPLTQKAIDVIHANYVNDLGEWVKGADDKYFMDYSNKSMDIFKVLALWDREIIKFKLRTEAEGMAKLLVFTEEGKEGLLTKKTGKLGRNKKGAPITGAENSNQKNAEYIKQHVDSVIYGKHLSNEADITFDIPVKRIASKINDIVGREIVTVPEEENLTVSGVKALDAMNRFFVTKTLGVNASTALANLFGGTINSFINQGIYFNKAELLQAEAELVAGRFWGSEDSKKMAGLLSYIHPYLEDTSNEQIRKLSLANAVKALSSDHLFFMQRGSDVWVNNIIAMAFIKNTMLRDGKLMNIRDVVRDEMNHSERWANGVEKGIEWQKAFDLRVKELQNSPESLIKATEIVKDAEGDETLSIPGVERVSDTVANLRSKMQNFTKDALGNTTREDLSLYKTHVLFQSFFMFKNWIPRMLDVRGQSLKYNPGSEKYEWGRVRMLFDAVRHLGLSRSGSLLKQLSGTSGNIVQVAKETYKRKQSEMAEEEQDFNMSEGEFVDMYIKGVRAEFKELALATGMIGMLIAARLLRPESDDSYVARGGYKWMLRVSDKLQDEIAFFYSPQSFTDIVNGSVFPAASMLLDTQRFFKTAIAKLFYEALGDDEKAQSEHVSRYLFKVLPITKELMTYVAIFNEDFAKEYGVRISAQNGSSR